VPFTGGDVNVDWGHLRRAARDAPAGDPAVPMRERFTDVGALTAQLDLPERPVEILNVWYIPRRSLQVVYRVGTGEDILRVRFLPADQPAPPLPPPAALVLPEWRAVAWWFPGDPALPELAVLGRPGELEARLGPVLATRLLSYLPGERCALRVRSNDGADLVLKVERPPETRVAGERLQRLWSARDRRFGMPEPLGFDSAAGLRWETFLRGRRLDADLSAGALGSLLPAVAHALGGLHAAGEADAVAVTPADILRRIERKVLPRVDGALPELSARARRLVTMLADARPRRDGTAVTLHGDLHTANALAGQDGSVTFLDLDSLARGHPEFDLALLGGRLLLVALTRGCDLGPVAAAVADLPRAYTEATGRLVTDADFAWYLAAHLLGRQLRTCIRHWVPGVSHLAPTLLAWAESTLATRRFDEAAIVDARVRPTATSPSAVVGPMSK
jgi:Phosphotransferase enzyme family